MSAAQQVDFSQSVLGPNWYDSLLHCNQESRGSLILSCRDSTHTAPGSFEAMLRWGKRAVAALGRYTARRGGGWVLGAAAGLVDFPNPFSGYGPP